MDTVNELGYQNGIPQSNTFLYLKQNVLYWPIAQGYGFCQITSIRLCEIHTEFGQVSSVGIATDYGLDGPGSNPGGDEIFRPSRPALGPNQTPVKWVQRLSRG